MDRRWLKLSLVLALALAAGGAGCRATGARPYAKDPLCASKKPVENATNSPPPVLYTAKGPRPPSLPAVQLAVKQKAGDPDELAARTVIGPRGPVLAVPAVRSLPRHWPLAVSDASPALHFDHAPDYSWLQGSLEKHFQGYLELRYGAATEDRWGGKVRLEHDPRFVPFRDGDVVRVEGMLVPDLDRPGDRAWDEYPAYRIRAIQLVHRH